MAPKMAPQMAPHDGPPSRGHSRDSSSASARHAHAPATPSQLRMAHAPSDRSSSPEETMHRRQSRSYYDDEPQQDTPISAHSTHDFAEAPQHDGIVEVDISEPNVRSRLLDAAAREDWSARPGVARNYGSFAGSIHSDHSFAGAFPGVPHGDAPDATHALLGDAFADGLVNSGDRKNMSTTRWLAERHGIKSQRIM